jgi:hypothetical protein
MKAKLTFDLNDPDDRLEHERCVKSLDIALVLWELTHNSYRSLTNGFDEDDSYYKGVDAVYDHLKELLYEHSVDIDKLIR